MLYKKEGVKMKQKWMMGIIFVCSLLILVISVRLFFNMGIYADEYNTTPDIVFGGRFWLSAAWLRLALSGLLTVISGIALFSNGKKP